MAHLKILIIIAIIFSIFVYTAFAANTGIKFSLNPVFGEHMVLQRDMPLEIFGQAVPGKTVSVRIAGQAVSAKADAKGVWSVKLAPISAGGPYEMSAACGETITLKDVLAGDVWFCSGQSNMEMRLGETKDGAEELKNFTEQPKIRLFMQGQRPAPEPATEPLGIWTACDAENTKNFSAVGYFFGARLLKELNVPIGLIDSSWGGTPIEIWTDANLIKNDPVTAPIYERWKKNPSIDWKAWNNGTGMKYELEFTDIRLISRKGKAEPAGVKLNPDMQGEYGGLWSAWAKPGSTAVCEIKGETGRLSGKVALGAWAGAGVMLKNGAPADLSMYDTIEFKARGSGKFSLSLGQDSIADFNYYTSGDIEPDKEWRLFRYFPAEFKQGNWGTPKPFTQDALTKLQFNVQSVSEEMPASLYNGMVMPFTRYRIKGAIWYQGEANADRAAQYATLLPMMITNWRKAWGEGDFPFLAVQLPNFMERKKEPSESAWAELREAQLKALSLPNTGVVPVIDLGEEKDIHPKIKQPVGARLAQAALGAVYHKGIVPMGPLYDSMAINGNKIILKFKYAGSGLEAKNGDLKGFAIAGDDRIFKWAKAEIKDDTVAVWNDEVKIPAAVRYAWADNPECNLYNKDGLAASPFRTDSWPGITEGKR